MWASEAALSKSDWSITLPLYLVALMHRIADQRMVNEYWHRMKFIVEW